jgi:Stage II sporulation protein M
MRAWCRWIGSVDVNQYVLVQGARRTRGVLERWNGDPWPVLRTWIGGARAVAAVLLGAVWLISSVATPDLTPVSIPGITDAPSAANVFQILFRNSLVLALHAFACVAGFIAGSSLPLSAERRTGFSRWIHEKARPVAFAWVIAVTCFSLGTQAYALGSSGATLAHQLHISSGLLLLTALPHAVPELTALFLPLAAWTIASRRGEWGDLLAATVATVAIAVPTLVCAALWETYVWPHLLQAASPLA